MTTYWNGPSRAVLAAALAILIGSQAACSDDEAPDEGAGPTPSGETQRDGGAEAPVPPPEDSLDAGRSSDIDAGRAPGGDAGSTPPARVDAGSTDAGSTDAGSPHDAGTDAGSQHDAGTDAGATAGDAGLARIQILGFNDFHGNLEPPSGSSGTVALGPALDGGAPPSMSAGGAAYFARQVAALRAENPNTLLVSAGDLIGASPLASALFHDEPTIEAMNLIGLDISGVGNHEFDEGREELVRMQRGGCHPVDGCQGSMPFEGARFAFLASNVLTDQASGASLFERYTVRELDGVKIAFIGMTLEGTPSIVTPSGIEGLSFRDEADTVNALVPELTAQGIQTIVVLVHEGGYQPGLYDACDGISGPIVDIVERLSPAVDLVVSGHTHAAYNCLIGGKRVTSALSFGRLITKVELTVDRATQDVVSHTAQNLVVVREVPPLESVQALVESYVARAEPLRMREIGAVSSALTRGTAPSPTNTETGEGTLGDLIADAQRAATLDASRSEPHVAFMNPGGVRADLDEGPVTYGEAFTIQPFGNGLVAMSLTGAELDTLLEQQFSAGATRILYPSANVRYVFDLAAPLGARVRDLEIEGEPVDPARTYRVTVNSFLATGGDGFTVLSEGRERVGGPLDLDALESYLRVARPLEPPALTRIVRAP